MELVKLFGKYYVVKHTSLRFSGKEYKYLSRVDDVLDLDIANIAWLRTSGSYSSGLSICWKAPVDTPLIFM